jgi:anti-sigma factor RsiW
MGPINCRTYEELVAADVDGGLTVEERRAVEAHLSTCASCRSTRLRQREARALLRDRSLLRHTPELLRRRIEAGVAGQAGGEVSRHRSSRRSILVGTAAAGILLALSFLVPRRPDLLSTLVRDVQAAEIGDLPLAVQSRDVGSVGDYYRRTGQVAFQDLLDDLGPVGYELVGGRVSEIGKVRTTLTVYQGASGRIVCRHFPTGSVPLPKGGEKIEGGEFFSLNGINIAVIAHGDVTCCLATRIPREELSRCVLAVARQP